MRTSDTLRLLLACAVLATPAVLGAETPRRAGTVEFSNGDSVSGRLSLPPGAGLKLHGSDGLKTVPLERVSEIRFVPEKEKMERKWRFEEAGQTRKRFWGPAYPVRHLRADVFLPNNETLSGHLYTTPLYIQGREKTRKIVLQAKQRGKGGEDFADLVYPVRVSFDVRGLSAGEGIRVRLPLLAGSQDAQLAALTVGALVRLEARKLSGEAEFLLPRSLGAGLFAAVKAGPTIWVGWPDGAPEDTASRVRNALRHVRDFFDERELLGVHEDQANDNVYSLMMLSRQGKTTLSRDLSQPWRIEVWRWKQDADGKLMLAGRGHFFRGITADRPAESTGPTPGSERPLVKLSAELWGTKFVDGATIDLEPRPINGNVRVSIQVMSCRPS